MRRLAMAAFLGLLLATPALAERATDQAGSFEIAWPADWAPGADPAWVEAYAPSGDGTNCLAERREEPGLSAMTQEQINAELRTPLTELDWQAFTGSGGLVGFLNGRVVDGPLVSQRATATFPTQDLRVLKVRLAVFLRPGEVFLALCVAPQAAFPAMAPLFETILDSFRPL